MKKIIITLCLVAVALACGLLLSKGGNTGDSPATINALTSKGENLYFTYSIDGKEFNLSPDDITTSYTVFSDTDVVFKIFAGKDSGPQLMLTIPADMSGQSVTPSGSTGMGAKLFQGSVSLQDYPEKGKVFNSFDGFLDPKPEVKADAIIITGSEKLGDEARIITGTVNVKTLPGNDDTAKPYEVIGKFRVKHVFRGDKF